MTSQSPQWRLRLPAVEAQRALYIDFEGTAREPASFLGVYCEGVWQVAVIEEALFGAVVEHRRGRLFAADRVLACRDLRERAEREGRKIIAWSNRERDEITSYDEWSDAERSWWFERSSTSKSLGQAHPHCDSLDSRC